METTYAEVKARGSVYGHAADRTRQWNSTSERVYHVVRHFMSLLQDATTYCIGGVFTSSLDEAVSYLDKAQNSRSTTTPPVTTMQTAIGATSTSRDAERMPRTMTFIGLRIAQETKS